MATYIRMTTEPVRVLHIIKSLGRGGAEMLLPETLKKHDKSQFHFHYIYFLPWKNQMVKSLQENGGIVTCFSANNNIGLLLQARRVAAYVKKNNIQLIHAHLPWAGVLARFVGRMTKVPVVYTEHNKQERYHFATRKMNLMTMSWLTELICVSDDVRNSVMKFKPSLRIPVQTILNGVNVDSYKWEPGGKEAAKITLGIPADSPVIGTIAVFRFQKRLEVWLQLAKQILVKNPSTKFIIVGDGPLKDKLHQQARELGLGDALQFPGLQTDVRPFLAAFDIYMMTSVFEGLPIALLEAMSSGCPVISTDAGGIKEVIRDGQDGLTVGVDEPNRLVDLALGLIADRNRRLHLGLNARTRVIESFSMDKMVQDLETTYRRIVAH